MKCNVEMAGGGIVKECLMNGGLSTGEKSS